MEDKNKTKEELLEEIKDLIKGKLEINNLDIDSFIIALGDSITGDSIIASRGNEIFDLAESISKVYTRKHS